MLTNILVRSSWSAASVVLLLTVCSLSLVAQQELPRSAQAVVAVQIQFDQLKKSLPLESNTIGEAFDDLFREIGMDGENPLTALMAQATRLTVVASAPKSMDQLMEMGPGDPIPMNFLIRVHFDDAQALQELVNEIERDSRVEHAFGKTIYSPDDDFAPMNLCAAQSGDTCLEFGTRQFVAREEYIPKDLFTSQLLALWDRQPEHAIRIAVDGAGAREFLEEVSQQMMAEAPFEARPFVDLLTKLASLSVALDFASPEILVIRAEGHNDSDGEALQTGIDSLVGMAKFVVMASERDMRRDVPDLFELMTEVVNSMTTQRSGPVVTLNVPRPNQWEQRLGKLVTAMRAATLEAVEVNNLRQVLLAMHNFESVSNHLPFVAQRNESAELSWRVRVLPYIEEFHLYQGINLDGAWDDEHNRQFHESMPRIYGEPRSGRTAICFVIPAEVPVRFHDIRDGTSNTIAMLVTSRDVPWMKPEDITIAAALECYDALKEGESMLAGFYDGSVRRITKALVKRDEFQSMLDPADDR